MSYRRYLQTTYQGQSILGFTPRIIDFNGDKIWVDNVIDLGDLIEKKMGIDTSELYFSVLADIIDGLSEE